MGSGLYSKDSAEQCQKLLQKNEVPPNLFDPYIEEIFSYLRGNIFKRYVESDKARRRPERSGVPTFKVVGG